MEMICINNQQNEFYLNILLYKDMDRDRIGVDFDTCYRNESRIPVGAFFRLTSNGLQFWESITQKLCVDTTNSGKLKVTSIDMVDD